jgi:cyclophilin family peptidyl-prolyl cis-trans isomerase
MQWFEREHTGMPKAASKRTRVRQAARVTRAHQTAYAPPLTRTRSAQRRAATAFGPGTFVQRYPWAIAFLASALVLGLTLTLHNARVWPFQPPAPHKLGCNLRTHVCDKPKMTVDANKAYTATIKTAKGDIVIALDVKDSPLAVNNFVYLAQQGFYNGLTFHRIEHKGQASPLDGSISTLDLIQGGDPKGTGQGGPGYKFDDDPITGSYVAGAVAMANSGANTNGSQFFICTGDDTGLPKQYSLFGHVISGLDVAQKIVAGDKMTSVTITVTTPTPTAAGATPSPTK